MRTHRFYTNIPLSENLSTELPSEAAHHCAQVLRYKVGDNLTVFNGMALTIYLKLNPLRKRIARLKSSLKKIQITNQT